MMRTSEQVDATGEKRMVRNILSSWGGHFIFIVAGFIMPRVMDHRVGQVSLGIWDFGWSFVSYMNLAGMGVGSSVAPHIARYRAEGKLTKLQGAVMSVLCIQMAAAVLVACLTITFALLLPKLFPDRLGDESLAAQWVVVFLGLSVVVQLAFDTSRGVMTGCHRWDLHNSFNAGERLSEVLLMVVVLLAGGSIVSLALTSFLVTVATEVFRFSVSRRLFPELRYDLRAANWSQAREMFLFGAKTIITVLPHFILLQVGNVLVVRHLGVAALAVYSRPISLVRHLETFMNKFAYVLTPTAGSLKGEGNNEALRNLMIESTRYSMALTIPPVIFMSLYGDLILRLWMGPNYASGSLLAIISVGYALPISQGPAMRILIGTNQHGRVGLHSLGIAITGLASGIVVQSIWGWSLTGVGLTLGGALTVSTGIVGPVLACQKVGVSLQDYFQKVVIRPLLCGVIFLACLYLGRYWFADRQILGAAVGGVISTAILVVLYWNFILSHGARSYIRHRFQSTAG